MAQIIRTGVVIAIFTVVGLTGQAAAQVPFKPLPMEVLAAWKSAGTEFGWLSGLYTPDLIYWPNSPNKPPFAAPTFRVIRWPDNVAKLPDPGVPFGLYLHLVKDENLKELAGLKSLHALSLGAPR